MSRLTAQPWSLLAGLGVALLFAAATNATAAESRWYRGLIGKTATDLDTPERYEENKEVEMELRVDDAGGVSGTYFYFGQYGGRGADITIEGRVAPDGTARLEERVGERVTGRWRGHLDGFDLHGTWTDPAGQRRLRFILQHLEDDEGEEHEIAPQVAYRGRRVVGTNLQLPFLSRHPRPDVMKAVNDQIQAAFEGNRCDPAWSFPAWPDDYDVSWEVGYASADLWSVKISVGWFCGAAYPNAEGRSLTFDLRTGKPVGLSDLFLDYETNEDAILETLFADAAASLGPDCKEAVALWGKNSGQSGGSVVRGIVLLGNWLSFHLTATALHVEQVGVAHAIGACALSADVPYERLRSLIAPGSPIALILDAQTPAR